MKTPKEPPPERPRGTLPLTREEARRAMEILFRSIDDRSKDANVVKEARRALGLDS